METVRTYLVQIGSRVMAWPEEIASRRSPFVGSLGQRPSSSARALWSFTVGRKSELLHVFDAPSLEELEGKSTPPRNKKQEVGP